MAKAKGIFLDKTGTITEGKIEVDTLEPVGEVSTTELLQLVYSLERSSGHILAKAVSDYAQQKGMAVLPMDSLSEVAGLGVVGTIDNQEIKIGRKSFVNAPEGLNYETAFYVSRAGKYIGAITFTDTLRPEAKETIKKLRQLGLSRIAMLTGDNETVAEKIASDVGISEIHAGLMPDEKLSFIKEAEERPIIMVGDGVNDAPALATADVGISIGVGSGTVASEAADIVLLQNDLSKVTQSIQISRDTMKIAKQAVMIGIVICIILMFIAAAGVIPAVIGALFQEVIDVISILYALRALRG